MLNSNVKSLIVETIELYSNEVINQEIIDSGLEKLVGAKNLLLKEDNEGEEIVDKLKIKFNELYEAHKNDEVSESELPYINREFYNHTFKPLEEVIIGFYVDDEAESYYLNEVESFYKLIIRDNHRIIKEAFICSGSQKINIGILPIGEHVLSMEVLDIYGRLSYRDYFEIRVAEPIEKVIYALTDEDLLTYSIDKTGVDFENTVKGFNQIIENLDEKYNYLIIPEGTYQMKYGECISMKDNLTLDLNRSHFILQPNQIGNKNMQMEIKQCYDAHIINGTVEGDYETHDYKNSPNNSEWVSGINMDGRSKYCSYENVTVKNITGYGSNAGMGADRNGAGYCWAIQYFTRSYNAEKRRYESNLIDLSKFKVEGCNYFQIGLYLGYQGKPSDSWYFNIQFYNESEELIDDFKGYYYRRIYIPDNVKYCKIQNMKNGWMQSNVCLFAFKVPVNCEFKNVRHEMCRCVGCAPSAMESLRLIDSYFTRCGSNGAKCAFDSEDGWDMMHDFYMTNTVFENNFLNDWLTCAGHNFLLENNEYDGSMYVWTRCQNYTIRNNKVKNISEGSNKDTHHVRIYNNECSQNISSSKTLIKDCKANRIIGTATRCELKFLSNSNGLVTNSVYTLDNTIDYLGFPLTIKNCEINLEEGLTSHLVSFNAYDVSRIFEDCNFNDGKYSLSNHNRFNSADFINCKFEAVHISAEVTTDTTLTGCITFKNCELPINGELIKLSPYAYTRGRVNIVFEGCKITDLGGGTADGYHKGTDLIYAFSKSTVGSITFKDCIIDKPEGKLLSGYSDASDFKLELIFENTPLSDNLVIPDTYLDNVTITQK